MERLSILSRIGSRILARTNLRNRGTEYSKLNSKRSYATNISRFQNPLPVTQHPLNVNCPRGRFFHYSSLCKGDSIGTIDPPKPRDIKDLEVVDIDPHNNNNNNIIEEEEASAHRKFGKIIRIKKRRPHQPTPPRAKATLRHIRIGHRKLNLVARVIRRMPTAQAKSQCLVLNKKARWFVYQAIIAAEHNAVHAYGMDRNRLIVSEAWVGKSKYIKKMFPWHGKGRFGIGHRYYSHLTVVVEEVPESVISEMEWRRYGKSTYQLRRFRDPKLPRARIPEDLIKPWLIRPQMEVLLDEAKARQQRIREERFAAQEAEQKKKAIQN